MARGLIVFRWLTLGWAWLGLVVERTHLTRTWLGMLLLGAATVVTIIMTIAATKDLRRASRLWLHSLEICVAASLLLVEAFVYEAGRNQSLAWAWPSAGILAVAITAGMAWGLGAAVALSVASWAGESMLRGEVEWSTATMSKTALFVLPAIAGALVANVLREAEKEISVARSRDEMGRVLHDGVLQTLAVIQRRSPDEELRALARDQERDLRAFLHERPQAKESLVARLRSTIETVSQRHSVDIVATLAADLPDLEAAVSEALAGAMGEALTNAAKHADATKITVFAEPGTDGGVYCSVRDDGVGFAKHSTGTGRGLVHSIERRIADVGGRVEIISSEGRGTEVQLWTT